MNLYEFLSPPLYIELRLSNSATLPFTACAVTYQSVAPSRYPSVGVTHLVEGRTFNEGKQRIELCLWRLQCHRPPRPPCPYSPSLTFQTVHVTINLAPCYVVGVLYYKYKKTVLLLIYPFSTFLLFVILASSLSSLESIIDNMFV